MRVLVDTFNVLHMTGILPPGLAGLDVAGLAALIGTSRWAENHVVLVCDGMPPQEGPPRLPGQIRAIYSRQKEADEILERLIADSSAPRSLLVVSSDRRVRRAASRRNARDLESDRFLRLLLEDRQARRNQPEPHHRPASLKPGEVNTWKNLFDVSGPLDDVGELPAHLEELASRTESVAPPEPPPSRKKPERVDPSVLLPADLLAQAESLIEEEANNRPPTPNSEQLEKPAIRDEKPPASSSRSDHVQHLDGELPDDLIREAERMLDDLEDEDMI